MNYQSGPGYGQSQFATQNIDFTQSQAYGTTSNYGRTGTGSANYDPKQSQFQGSDIEVRNLFDAFQRNGKVDLNEFLEILNSTGNLSLFILLAFSFPTFPFPFRFLYIHNLF